MKKFLLACVLALPMTVASTTPASAWGCGDCGGCGCGFGFKIGIGFSFSFSGSCCGSCTPCCDTGCAYGCGGYGGDSGYSYGYGATGGYDGLAYGNGYPTYAAPTGYAGVPMAAPTQAAGYQQPSYYPNYGGFQPVNFQAPAYWYGR